MPPKPQAFEDERHSSRQERRSPTPKHPLEEEAHKGQPLQIREKVVDGHYDRELVRVKRLPGGFQARSDSVQNPRCQVCLLVGA